MAEWRTITSRPRAHQSSCRDPGSQGKGSARTRSTARPIRFYDADLAAWRSTWAEPINGRVRKFVGRDEEVQIVISLDDDPLLRWRFTEIQPDSFTWLGEDSQDEGRTWRLEERMLATRLGA